jgi:protein tyrosine phosphatase (PTP) superfamily phosphohydrolase (DUF442 family)
MGPHWVQIGHDLWRGPQPDSQDLADLKALGLTAVVNLRLESEITRELCRELGLDYHYFPVRDWTIPERSQVEEFLTLFEKPGVRLVHCLGGIGRTGVFVSCYRIARGMTANEAITQSHTEVTWMSMNGMQMDFVWDFGRWWQERNRE